MSQESEKHEQTPFLPAGSRFPMKLVQQAPPTHTGDNCKNQGMGDPTVDTQLDSLGDPWRPSHPDRERFQRPRPKWGLFCRLCGRVPLPLQQPPIRFELLYRSSIRPVLLGPTLITYCASCHQQSCGGDNQTVVGRSDDYTRNLHGLMIVLSRPDATTSRWEAVVAAARDHRTSASQKNRPVS